MNNKYLHFSVTYLCLFIVFLQELINYWQSNQNFKYQTVFIIEMFFESYYRYVCLDLEDVMLKFN